MGAASDNSVAAKNLAISVIAKPLADDKLCKKVLKLAKKGAKRKQIKRGVKEVVKALRKNTQGCAATATVDLANSSKHQAASYYTRFCRICIIAGDISPIDVVTHLPVLCEDRDIPYIYVPSKEVNCYANDRMLRSCKCLAAEHLPRSLEQLD